MNNKGYWRFYRDLHDKQIWIDSTPEQKVILVTLLSMANYKPHTWEWNGKRYCLEPGEFITSLSSIAEKAGKGISIRNVRTALKNFQAFGFLTIQTTNKNSKISIVNWGFYQGLQDEVTNKVTSKRHEGDNYKEGNKEINKKTNNNRRQYDADEPPFKLAQFLLDEIRKNNPGFKEPNLQTWADDMRKMIDLDKRDLRETSKVIRFAQQSDFWRSNILSAKKLREKYDTLFMQMTNESQVQKPFVKSTERIYGEAVTDYQPNLD